MAANDVRKALVFNPYCPTRIGVVLAPMLRIVDLKELAKDPNVHVVLRGVAAHLVTIRQSRAIAGEEEEEGAEHGEAPDVLIQLGV